MDLNTESMLKYQDLSDADKRAFVVRYEMEKKKPWVYYLLLFFLGGIGVHKFYVRQNGLGIIYIIVSLLAVLGNVAAILFGLVRFGLVIYDLFTGVSQVRQCNQDYFRSVIDEMKPKSDTSFDQWPDIDSQPKDDSPDNDIPNTGLM